MINHERIDQAAYNNATWCDTICRAHGHPGEFLDDIWINRHAPPRFYPNAVTLMHNRSATQIAHIRDLIESGLSGEWGVKDSYCALDLAPLGFRMLFEAEWLYRPASLPKPDADMRWAKITDASELTKWEEAWAGADFAKLQRVFLPSLLADKNITFIAIYRGQHIVAGVIANRSGNVAGVSNLFVPDDSDHLRATCIAGVIDAFGGLPLVGYEHGHDLAQALTLGFESLGALRVWLKVEG